MTSHGLDDKINFIFVCGSVCGCGLIVFVLYYHVPVSCRTDVAVSVPQVRLFACVASNKMSIRSGRDDVGCLVSADGLYFKAGGVLSLT